MLGGKSAFWRTALTLGIGAGLSIACNGGPTGAPAAPPGSSTDGKAEKWADAVLHQAEYATASVRLTVYSDGSALVTDERPLTLEAGSQVARWPRVAATTDIRGALLEVPGATTVRQRFRYDPVEREKLLARYHGKEVQLFSPEASQTITATLYVTPSGPLYKVDDKVYVDPPGKLILPGLADAALEPTLEFMVMSPAPWSGRATASYVAGNMDWSSEYTLVTDEKQAKGRFAHWAALTNKSGAQFVDADLTLVAAGAGRGGPRPYPMMAEGAIAGMAPRAAPMPFMDVAAERFATRYQFHLPDKVTLERDSEERLLLGDGNDVAITRAFRIESGVAPYLQPEPELPVKARVRLTIENTKDNKLGVPLPAGRLTVFTPNKQGTVAISGETGIPDTPDDQKLLLELGEAFDITAKRTQTDFKEFPDAKEVAHRIVLKNKMDEASVVEVIENLPGDGTMLEKTLEVEKISTSQIRFKPQVPAGGEVTLTYRVRINEPQKPRYN